MSPNVRDTGKYSRVGDDSIPPAERSAIADADRLLAIRKAELQDIEEDIARKKRATYSEIEQPILSDATIGRGVKWLVMRYGGYLLVGFLGAGGASVISHIVNPPADANKVDKIASVQQDRNATDKDFDTRLSTIEKHWDVQKKIDESTQDWVALLLHVQNITPRASDQEHRIPNSIPLNTPDPIVTTKKAPKYETSVELQPIPARW